MKQLNFPEIEKPSKAPQVAPKISKRLQKRISKLQECQNKFVGELNQNQRMRLAIDFFDIKKLFDFFGVRSLFILSWWPRTDNALRILDKIKKGLTDLTKVDNDVNDAYSNGIANGFSGEFLVSVEVYSTEFVSNQSTTVLD